MSQTRSKDIAALIDEKLEEFKTSFMNEILGKLDVINDAQKAEIGDWFEGKKKELVKQNDEYATSIRAVQDHVRSLQEKHELLESVIEDLQQYGRRPSLRIFGVKAAKKESEEDVISLVADAVKGAGGDVPNCSIDRGHRVGQVRTGDDGVQKQPIIVRFISVRDRTKVYKLRKTIKEKYGYGISLDLTKRRYKLLKKAKEIVKDFEGIKFAYADVNCQLRVLLEDGRHLAFNSVTDLCNITGNL